MCSRNHCKWSKLIFFRCEVLKYINNSWNVLREITIKVENLYDGMFLLAYNCGTNLKITLFTQLYDKCSNLRKVFRIWKGVPYQFRYNVIRKFIPESAKIKTDYMSCWLLWLYSSLGILFKILTFRNGITVFIKWRKFIMYSCTNRDRAGPREVQLVPSNRTPRLE